MVRRKGHSRRSYAYLRLKKYRLKWTRDTIPLQFKLMIPPMEDKIGDSLTSEDEVERQTLAECEKKGVPQNLIKPYFAFAKKVFAAYMKYWYETAEKEINLLVSEFMLRGLNRNVLEQIKTLMYSKAEVKREIVPPFTCEDVYACLEGDYSDWAIYDSFDDAEASLTWFGDYAIINRAETVALLIHVDNVSVRKYDIATKTLGGIQANRALPGILFFDKAEGTIKSVLATYVVGLIYAGYTYGNGIVVWKNGDAIKTLSALDLGLDTNKVYSVSISPSGKYIVVVGRRTATSNVGCVVLVGS